MQEKLEKCFSQFVFLPEKEQHNGGKDFLTLQTHDPKNI